MAFQGQMHYGALCISGLDDGPDGLRGRIEHVVRFLRLKSVLVSGAVLAGADEATLETRRNAIN